MNDTLLDFVDQHKHLGLSISSDLNWHDYINNITCAASKEPSYMRSLKFKVKRSTINQSYVSYMSPILEHVSVGWDECTAFEAARVLTGLTRSV